MSRKLVPGAGIEPAHPQGVRDFKFPSETCCFVSDEIARSAKLLNVCHLLPGGITYHLTDAQSFSRVPFVQNQT